MELDPLFIKALGFLRSKNKESADQLRELLDDVISGGGRSRLDKPLKQASFSGNKGGKDRNLVKDNRRGQSSPLRKTPAEETKRETEKRSLDRAKTDTSDSDVAPPKKAKLERPQRQAVKPVIEDDDDTTEEDSDDSNHDDSGKEDTADTNTGGSTDADDFALELGLACVVCKKMDVSVGNQLIECQECHNLYHQQCHKPAATDADPNDPRLVWYCARCARNMKRMASKKPKSLPTSGRDSKGFEKSEESTMNMFKRSEPKTVSPSGTSSNKQPFTGLAGMAANLGGGRPSSGNNKPTKPIATPAGISQRSSSRSSVSSPVSKTVPRALSSPSSSSSKSSSSSSKSSGNSGKSAAPLRMSTASSAMKRLQIMKKKASKR